MAQKRRRKPGTKKPGTPPRRRRRKKQFHLESGILIVAVALMLAISLHLVTRPEPEPEATEPPVMSMQPPVPTEDSFEPNAPLPTLPVDASKLSTEEKLRVIQSEPGYPDYLISFAKNYPQAIDFVYGYPYLKDERPEFHLPVESYADSVPLLMQWDPRWGYYPYGDGVTGNSGCGPLCLSMVALYLTQNDEWTPDKVVQYANNNNYCISGCGSSWTLISEGCEIMGLHAEELPLVESLMKEELDAGNPIIIVVGPGLFTNTGHFLVITGYGSNGFFLNDPNNAENSTIAWPFETLESQIENLWAMSLAE